MDEYVRLRPNGEPSIVALLRAVAVADGKLTTLVDDDMEEPMTKLEQSPHKSSASLGAAEHFAETLGGLLRTHREDLRERLGVAVRADSLAFEWLVSYVTHLYNRFQVRVNGLMPFEDLHGRYALPRAPLQVRPAGACAPTSGDSAREAGASLDSRPVDGPSGALQRAPSGNLPQRDPRGKVLPCTCARLGGLRHHYPPVARVVRHESRVTNAQACGRG